MADVFISYASEDREIAAALAGKLTSRGFSVWWDHHLVGGSEIRDEIRKQLLDARIAIVIWSANGINSRWVRDEADEALRLNKILPVKPAAIDITLLPFGHRGSRVVALDQFDEIVRAIRVVLGGKEKLTAKSAIRGSGNAAMDVTSSIWRYSYEYGLHIMLCFIAVPICIELLQLARYLIEFKQELPTFNIWVQLGIFFGCLGWSTLISTILRLRYDSGIFLAIMCLMFITLILYLFTPASPMWAKYSSNFLISIQSFLAVGGFLWMIFFVRRILSSRPA